MGITYAVAFENEKYSVSTYKEKDSGVFPNFQISLVGAEVGSRQWRGFAEMGFGEQGILMGGLRYRF